MFLGAVPQCLLVGNALPQARCGSGTTMLTRLAANIACYVTITCGGRSQVGPLDTLTTNGNTSQVVRPLTAPGQVPWVKRPRSNAGAGWLGTFLSPVSH